MSVDLSSKTILVTGCGDGIGRELVKQLIAVGAHVIGVSRTERTLKSLAQELEGKKFQPVVLDLSNWQATKATLGALDVKLDGIVNNAGIAIIKPFAELTEEDFDMQMNVNFKACFNVLQTLLPKLVDGASIVNISSLAGLKAFADHSAYSASKASLDSLTRSLALELAPRKIRVNSVNPTVILTKMGRENWSDPAKAAPLLSRIPLNRFGEVQEVVDPIIYLLSDRSSYINGTMLPIEGGYLV